jgi:hypothetical protein
MGIQTAPHRAIAKGDGRLALALLDRLGLASPPSATPGPTDPKLALDEIAIEADEHRDALNRRLNAICHTDVFASHSAPSHLESLRRQATASLPALDPADGGS